MSKSATPGPWEVDTSTEICMGQTIVRRKIYHQSQYGPAEVPINNVNGKTPQAEANARLIAAAPDLLKALKLIEPLWGQWGLGDDPETSEAAYNTMVAAIAKAEGSQP